MASVVVSLSIVCVLVVYVYVEREKDFFGAAFITWRLSL